VIVGAYAYSNGQTNEGRAFVYHGSASGLSTTAAWTAESDRAYAIFGWSVSTAGDVNGDGYSDVIVGAYGYDNGQTDEGRVYVYYGNNGPSLSYLPRQLKTDNTQLPILGKSDSQTSFKIRAKAKPFLGRTKVKMVWEVKARGTNFNGSSLSRSSSWTDTTASGATITETVSGLTSATYYHWRARFVSQDGRYSSPWFSAGPNGWNEADFRTDDITYTVSYDGNGNTGGTAPANQTKTHGVDLTLQTNSGSLVKTGYTFNGWNTAANGSGTHYAVSGTFSTDAATTLYAEWTTVSTCTSWTYSDWSSCSNGTQTRTVVSSLPSGCSGGSPVLSQSCSSGGGGGLPSIAYSLPTVPADGFKILINNGAKTTKNRNVTLTFNAGSDVKKMAISNTSDFANVGQEEYTATKQWTLSSGDGTKTIYVKFYTSWGQSSQPISASIVLRQKSLPVADSTNLPTSIFTKNLRLGMIDPQVKQLQIFLNTHGFKLADVGSGSPGQETTKFGVLTKTALIKFQEANFDAILKPSNLKSGTGLFYSFSRKLANEILSKEN